jgi:hypothetical protein
MQRLFGLTHFFELVTSQAIIRRGRKAARGLAEVKHTLLFI